MFRTKTRPRAKEKPFGTMSSTKSRTRQRASFILISEGPSRNPSVFVGSLSCCPSGAYQMSRCGGALVPLASVADERDGRPTVLGKMATDRSTNVGPHKNKTPLTAGKRIECIGRCAF